MTIDLTRPEHREALRWACGLQDEPAPNHHASLALALIQDPSQSAAIVRALLEGCGVPGCSTFEYRVEVRHGNDMAFIDLADGPMFDRCAAWVFALILALLDATDRDSALAALREAVR